MWVALVPSGMDWLDAEIGGVPAAGVVAAVGDAGSGKTSLALGYTIAQLRRGGRVCYLTAETPEAVIETCRGMLERDLHPWIAQNALSLFSFAPFFISKVRSLNSVDPPLAELKELFDERRIDHIVIDTLDPMLSWIDAANAKVGVRNILGQIQGWGRSVLCTMSGATPAAAELARTASGSLELGEGKLVIRHAGWCNVYDVEAALQFVQGRGPVARPQPVASRGRTGGPPSDRSLIIPSPVMIESERQPLIASSDRKPFMMSLIGDSKQIMGAHAAKLPPTSVLPPVEPAPPVHFPSGPPPPPIASPLGAPRGSQPFDPRYASPSAPPYQSSTTPQPARPAAPGSQPAIHPGAEQTTRIVGGAPPAFPQMNPPTQAHGSFFPPQGAQPPARPSYPSHPPPLFGGRQPEPAQSVDPAYNNKASTAPLAHPMNPVAANPPAANPVAANPPAANPVAAQPRTPSTVIGGWDDHSAGSVEDHPASGRTLISAPPTPGGESPAAGEGPTRIFVGKPSSPPGAKPRVPLPGARRP